MTINSIKNHPRQYIYWMALFVTLSSSLVSYTNSSFLSSLTTPNLVGLIYIVCSIISIILFLIWPEIIKKIELRKIIIFSALIITSTGLLLINSNAIQPVTLFLFITFFTTGPLLRYSLDLYLENFSDNNSTGHIRGIFMTIINIAWLLSPLVVGYILDGSDNYRPIYALAGLTLLPVIAIFGFMPKPKTISQKKIDWSLVWRPNTKKERAVRNILSIDLILNFFYALMVIYTPIYLHQYLNFSWEEIGIIFTIMLLPFVLVEYPLGLLADRHLGEKEIITTGICIMSFATAILCFLPTNLYLWATFLFITRVGAAAVEIAKETYLFKTINSADSSVLAMSRMTISLSYIIGPLFVTIFLLWFELKLLFLALGFITLLGLYFSYHLIDTK